MGWEIWLCNGFLGIRIKINSKSFNYLNYDGGQFSTSKGRGVFMNQALEILPSDYWRWWLLSNVPESSDSEFTWESFQQGINKDLADGYGVVRIDEARKIRSLSDKKILLMVSQHICPKDLIDNIASF